MYKYLKRIQDIILYPKITWEKIREEKCDSNDFFIKYVLVLAVIPSFAKIIGRNMVGVAVGREVFYMPFSDALIAGIIQYMFNILLVYFSAVAINLMAQYFIDSQDYWEAALKLAVYSSVPFWLSGVFLAYPPFSILFLVNIYCLHVFSRGIPELFRLTPDRGLLFVLSSMLLVVILGFLAITFSDHFYYVPLIAGNIIF